MYATGDDNFPATVVQIPGGHNYERSCPGHVSPALHNSTTQANIRPTAAAVPNTESNTAQSTSGLFSNRTFTAEVNI